MKYLVLFFSSFFVPLIALIDLDEMEQSFVLETKQIHVPGYPDAFNPSIIAWDNRILMSFRSRGASQTATLVGFIWLDKDFNPVGKPQMLKTKKNSYIQDPRLIAIDDRLYMAYSDLIDNQRKMCLAELVHDGSRFVMVQEECFHHFHGIKNNKFEKNWVPFNYQGLLLFGYAISPHRIFLPVPGESKCLTFAETYDFHPWAWGELRGGTQALLIDDHYVSFFHSSISLETVQSNAENMTHYFMGAYAFEKDPPFAIKKISPHPIVSRAFYNGKSYKTWKPLRVVFPCGYIYDKKFIWISYGRQDYESWVVKIDKKGLINSLVSFESYRD